jgi:SEC-C motif
MQQRHAHTSNRILDNEIRQVTARYPALKYRVSGQGETILEGEFPVKDDEGKLMDSFDIRMIYPGNFPFAYPQVCETGGRFSRQRGDLHINGNGTMCLNAPQQERIDCYYGLDTLAFFEKILIPNLSWRACVIGDIPFDRKAWGHGISGVIENYEELLQLKGAEQIVGFLKAYLSRCLPGRNDLCFCPSGKKYKLCHGRYESILVKIGDAMLRQQITEMQR